MEITPLERGFLRYMYMPSPFYPASVVFFQLHGGHGQSYASISYTLLNCEYLDPYHIATLFQLYLIVNTWILIYYHWSHISFSCLFLTQCCRDVASGADKHLDITFGLQVVESSSLVSVLFREAFNHPYISFFRLLVNGFSVTCFRTFFADPLPSLDWWAVSVGREKLKWCQLAHHQLMSQQRPNFSPHSKAKANYRSTNLRKIIN